MGPTAEDLANTKCPPDYPNVCPPSGYCCSAFQFCHAGDCEPCFPSTILEAQQKQWCHDVGYSNSSSMRHPSCRLACVAKFGLPIVPENDDCLWCYIVIGLLILALIILVIGFICRQRRFHLRCRASVSSIFLSHKPYSAVNSKDESKDENPTISSEEPDIKKEQQIVLTARQLGSLNFNFETATDQKQVRSTCDHGHTTTRETTPPPASMESESEGEPLQQQRSNHVSRSRSESRRRTHSSDGSTEREPLHDNSDTSRNSSPVNVGRQPFVNSPTCPDDASKITIVTSATSASVPY